MSPQDAIQLRGEHVAAEDRMLRAQLVGVTHRHEAPLGLAAPSPYGIEHRAQQRLHAPRRNIDDQTPTLASRDQCEVVAQQVEMPVPLERRRWFQNGPEVPHESSQIAPQLETVKLEQGPV